MRSVVTCAALSRYLSVLEAGLTNAFPDLTCAAKLFSAVSLSAHGVGGAIDLYCLG